MKTKLTMICICVSAMTRVASATEVATAVPAPPVVVERPWAVTAEGSFSFTSVPAYASFGVGLERHFGRYLAVDASIAKGLSAVAPTKTAEVRLDPWLDVATRVRFQLPVDQRGYNSFFLAAGPRLSEGGAYGTLWHGEVQVGYSLHTKGGFSLLYAIGAETPLVDRTSSIVPSSCVVGNCAPAAKVGDWAAVARMGLGYAF
ncbi:MAG TPA: hypothetical protein VH560_19705 [Polyangia bacterium]|jgi:hypothetical protein|nr:hypothetical protein [Polyangia bacterium]